MRTAVIHGPGADDTPAGPPSGSDDPRVGLDGVPGAYAAMHDRPALKALVVP